MYILAQQALAQTWSGVAVSGVLLCLSHADCSKGAEQLMALPLKLLSLILVVDPETEKDQILSTLNSGK